MNTGQQALEKATAVNLLKDYSYSLSSREGMMATAKTRRQTSEVWCHIR